MEQTKRYREFKKGIELSQEYFYQVVYPMLTKEFSDYLPRMAAGLIGAGSECYGYDDVMSQDRDFGVAYQILIPGEDEKVYGKWLREKLANLPKTFGEYKILDNEKNGLMSIETFYERYLGLAEGPVSDADWKEAEEEALSTATNGKVFFDNYGKFTAVRTRLLSGYPEQERLRRLALYCEKAGKSGQYNLYRCTSRRQWVAASLTAAEFMDEISRIVFLLNRTYRPYFKWFPNRMQELPVLGAEISRNMEYFSILSIKQDKGTAVAMAENMSQMIIGELKREGLTSGESRFLEDHAREIREKFRR